MSPVSDGISGLLSGHRILVCDGALGTLLHAAGAALDRQAVGPRLVAIDALVRACVAENKQLHGRREPGQAFRIEHDPQAEADADRSEAREPGSIGP